MEIEQLLQRIQGALVRELSPQHIETLRGLLGSRPDVAESLLEELESRTTDNAAPPLGDSGALEEPDAFVQRVEQLATVPSQTSQRRAAKARWLAGAMALILIVVGIARFSSSPNGQVKQEGPGDSTKATDVGQATTDSKAPNDLVAGATNSPIPSSETTSVDSSKLPPLVIPSDAPARAPSSPWRILDDTSVGGISEWRRSIDSVIQTQAGAPLKLANGESTFGLNGTYKLRPPAKEGDVVRLRLLDLSQLEITLWNHRDAARVQWVDGWLLRGLLASITPAQKAVASLPFSVTTDDGGRWRVFRKGTIDIRYEKGHLVLARGTVVLLKLPMTAPPTHATIQSHARLKRAERLTLPPLPASEQHVRETDPAPAIHVWPANEQADQPVRLERLADQATRFSRPAGENRGFRSAAKVETLGGAQIILHLAGARAGTGFFYESPTDARLQQFFVAQRGTHSILCEAPFDDVDRSRYFAGGFVLKDSFFARVTFAIDHERVDISHDGQHWVYFFSRIVDAEAVPRTHGTVGICGADGTGPREILLRSFSIHRPRALERLADAKLLAAVTEKAAESSDVDWQGLLRKLVTARPTEVDQGKWWTACLAKILERDAPARIRAEAAMQLAEAGIRQGVSDQLVLDALREIPQRIALDDGASPVSWNVLWTTYNRLAQRAWSTGRRDQIHRYLNGLLGQDFGVGARTFPASLGVLPDQIIRLRLFDLWDQNAYPELARLALQHEFLNRAAETTPTTRTDRPVSQLARWMYGQAAARDSRIPPILAAPRSVEMANAPSHPLVLDMDRETLNVVSELLAAVRSKEFDYACRILTQRSLPAGLAPVDETEQLYQSVSVLVRELIDAHPEMQTTLKKEFSDLASLRIQNALEHGHFDELAILVTQFRGTAAAQKALRIMADRDLSMGNLARAARRYEDLSRSGGAPEAELRAMRRMTAALRGERFGEPANQALSIGDSVVQAREFEQIIQSLLASRKPTNRAYLSTRHAEAAPTAGRLRPTVLGDIPFPEGPLARQQQLVAWSGAGGYIIANFFDRLLLLDPNNKRLLWQHPQQRDAKAGWSGPPAEPLVVGQHVIVPFFVKNVQTLASFRLADGELHWFKKLEDGILGGPVFDGTWLNVLTVTRQAPGLLDVHLRRLAVNSGESDFAKRLIRFHNNNTVFQVGRPTMAEDTLLFCAGNTVVAVGSSGDVRWVRRLPWVPPNLGRTHAARLSPSKIVVHQDRVFVTCPGSPYVHCLDVRNGNEFWRHLLPDIQATVGIVEGRLIVATDGMLKALDLDTGKLLWQAPTAAKPQSIMPAKNRQIVAVSQPVSNLQRQTDGGKPHRVQWFSARDGRPVFTLLIQDRNDELHAAASITSNGSRILVLTSAEPEGMGGRLILFEPVAPSPSGP